MKNETEKAVTSSTILSELEPLLREFFVGTVRNLGSALKLRLVSGEEFFLTVEKSNLQ